MFLNLLCFKDDSVLCYQLLVWAYKCQEYVILWEVRIIINNFLNEIEFNQIVFRVTEKSCFYFILYLYFNIYYMDKLVRLVYIL